MVIDFIKQFTDDDIGKVVKLHKSFYLVNDELLKIKEGIDMNPEYIGVYLGDEKPSLALLEILSKHSKKKVFVNAQAEYLFLCGRDIFGKSITRANVQKGLVLIQNQKDENLGYGKIVQSLDKKDRIVIKNFLDRGDFLRREK